MQVIREFLYPGTAAGKFAFRSSIAIILATYITLVLHLYDPLWAVMSVIIVMHPMSGPTLEMGIMRIVGTLLGALVGYFLAGLVANHILFFLLSIFFIVLISVYLTLRTRYIDASIIGGTTAFLVIANLVYHPNMVFSYSLFRVAEILVGVITAWVVAVFVFPLDTKQCCRKDSKTISKNILTLFQLVVAHYQGEENSDKFSSLITATYAKLDENEKLLHTTRPEFGTTIYDLSLLSQMRFKLKSLAHQLEIMYLCKDRSLDYQLISDSKLPITALIEKVEALFEKIINHDTIYIDETMQALSNARKNLGKMFLQMREDETILQYPQGEGIAFHGFISQIDTTIAILIDIKQLVFEQKKLDDANIANCVNPRIYTNKINAINYSLKAGLSTLLALIIWLLSNWHAGLQGVMSSMVISYEKNAYDARYMAQMRLIGCILGGGVGLLTLHFFIFDTRILMLVLYIFCWLFAYIRVIKPKTIFMCQQACIALAMTLLQSTIPPITIAPALERLAGILIGIAAAFIIGQLIWPSDPHKMLQASIQRTYSKLRTLYNKLIFKQLTNKEITHYQADLHHAITEQRQLFSSLLTYHHANEPQMLALKKTNDNQQALATLLLSIAATTDLDLVAIYQKKLDFYTEDIIASLNFYWDDVNNQTPINKSQLSLALDSLTAQVVTLRENKKALTLPYKEVENFLFYINNLKNILNICIN